MKVVFVCSPFQGKKENIEKAKKYCRMLVDMGYIPIAPHVYFSQFMDDLNPEDRRKALEMNKKLLEFCDELWVFGEEITEGMREEIEYFVNLKGLSRVRVIKIEKGKLVTVGLIEHFDNNLKKIDDIYKDLQPVRDWLERIEAKLRQLETAIGVKEKEEAVKKKEETKLEVIVNENVIDRICKAVEDIYYSRSQQKSIEISVNNSFSFVVYHFGRGGIGKEIKPKTRYGIVVRVLTQGRNVLEFVPYIDGESQGGLLIPRSRIKDLKGKVVEKVKELLERVYGVKVISKESGKDPNLPSSFVPKAHVGVIRKCPRCGGNMCYDPTASQPRSFKGELKPRLICTHCGYVIQ